MDAPHPDPFTYRDFLKKDNLYSFLTALVMLGVAFAFEHVASVYAYSYLARPTSVYVGDILLDNLPVVNLNFIIIEGALSCIVLGTLFVFSKPRYILFTLKTVALFIATRAFFTSLTHIGIYPGAINPGAGFLDSIYMYLDFQTGFFFSGHTGLPFLMALIFWREPLPRIVLLLLSFVFAVAVLLAHVHYSIDVFAAPFMAYGIFAIAKKFFPRDYALIGPESRESAPLPAPAL
ncbi:MAG: phosphatase PAP2-related protein [Minisyncoccota bacterium]